MEKLNILDFNKNTVHTASDVKNKIIEIGSYYVIRITICKNSDHKRILVRIYFNEAL